MDTHEEMLDAVSEAALIGTSESAVSRARSQHPTHPANGPRAERVQIGRRLYIRAPRADVLAWWPPAGAGLTVLQWTTLRAALAGEDVEWTPRVRSVLRVKGLIDEQGTPTDAARALDPATAGTGRD